MGQQNEQLLSKIATGNGHCENSSYFDGWKAYDRNPFHPIRNPGGVIQMGLAENLLCLDLIKEWIGKHPQSSICTEKGLEDFESIANFQDYHGLPSFRQGIAKFMGKVRGGKVDFDPDRIVMSGGGTGAQETLAFCLADPGDAFLVPTPYYPAFDRDFCWRTGVKLIPIDCYSFNNFKITKNSLEVCFANMDGETMRVALERIRGFVGKVKGEIGLERKEKKFDGRLRLSLPRGRKLDDGVVVSCLLSPHSPLVKAAN
ncbi:hypothetical protein LUZ60_016367 [Juncus effusus]|nr:hypothetical protein LUZ60_016367 [Juncus effusus]